MWLKTKKLLWIILLYPHQNPYKLPLLWVVFFGKNLKFSSSSLSLLLKE